ncbi:MAG: hypothetical protein Q4F41_17125 [Eubacteriales bacterium]|nr:hypothetical protein [Eubacteriales bacterium]
MKSKKLLAAAGVTLLAVMLSAGSAFAADDECPDSETGLHVAKAEVEVIDATCTSNRFTYHVCEYCGAMIDDPVEVPNTMLPHSYEEDSWDYDDEAGYPAPTCTTAGIAMRECVECGAIETKTVAALKHSWEREDTVAEDIEWDEVEGGYHCAICEDCEAMGPKQAHQWDAGEVTEPATPEETGTLTYTCTVCSAEKEETIPKVKIAVPTNLTATAGKTTVSLKWKKAADADGYVVYRSDASGKTRKLKETKNNSYSDKNLTDATGYTYTVCALLNIGEDTYEGAASEGVHVITTVGQTKGLKASVTAADLKNSQVTLKWTAVSGADGYYVYQAAGSGKMKLIQTVAGENSCVVENVNFSESKKYSYQVCAYVSYEDEIKLGKTSSKASVSKPKGLEKQVNGLKVASTTKTSIRLKWDKYTDADGYEIYRADSTKKTLTKVGTSKTNSYTDKKLKAAKGYTYAVRAYWTQGGKKSYSKYSVEVNAVTTVAKVTKPAVKRATKASASTKAALTWKTVGQATTYYIYQKSGSEKFEVIGKVEGGKMYTYNAAKGTYKANGKAKVSGNKITYTVTGLNFQKYKTFQFKVAAAVEYGNLEVKGAQSSAVTLKK